MPACLHKGNFAASLSGYDHSPLSFLLSEGTDVYRLYEFSSSGNCYKLRLAMAQLNVPFERVEKNITQGETRHADFLAINPNGRIPVLVTPDGRVLPESNAALWYLARDSQLMPDDAFEQAQVLQWMFFEQYNHEPNIATSRYWLHVLGEAEKYAQGLKEKQQKGYEALAIMELHLQRQDFLSVQIIPLLISPCSPIPMLQIRAAFR